MTLTFDEGMSIWKKWLITDGRAVNPGKRAALNALKRYLQENSIPYSFENALEWLSIKQPLLSNKEFFRYRRAVFELNDIMSNGRITGNYKYYNDPFDELSIYWQKKVTEYISHLKTFRLESAVRSQRVNCIKFASFLSKSEIQQSTSITGDVIFKYFEYADSIGETYSIIYSIRFFLQFLSDQGHISPHLPYILTAPIQSKAIGYAIAEFSKTKKCVISSGIEPETFWKQAVQLPKYLSYTYGYDKDSLRSNFTAYFQMYYVFCAEKNILCSVDSENFWFSIMKNFWKGKQQSSVIRAFHLLHIFESKGYLTNIDLKQSGTERGAINRLSGYYQILIKEYLSHQQLKQVTEGTLNTLRSGALSFFLYLQEKGFDNVAMIDYINVKQYCIWISENASNHINNYAYALYTLLEYLFEMHHTPDNLSCALPPQSSHTRKIVDILSEEEVNRLYNYRDSAKTPLQYRDSAILMLGLLMGLRRIDIVNLKESDIDWDERTISITQQKTYRPLVLPMPVLVGNSIYLYQKYGRPQSNSEYIFLSFSVPYNRVNPIICAQALSRVLPERGTRFHILRRTFASRLLLAGTDTMKIKDSLGHSSMNTVHSYLSIDEKSLKSCCLPLEGTMTI